MNGTCPAARIPRHRLRLVRLLIALLAAVAAIAAMECIVFNLPFWRTLGASTDTNAVHNTLGSGLTRRNDGMLTVTDPTKAYLELTADGTSDYLRIDTASSKVIDKAREQAEAESEANDDKEVFKPLATIHVRADVDGITGQAQSMNPDAIRSHYVKAPGAGHRAYLDSGRARRDRTGHRLPRQRARTVRHQLDARARHGLGVADDCRLEAGIAPVAYHA